MISADFYPTTHDLTDPVRQLTDNIEYNPNGTTTGIELSDAYWLGWMKWETFPDCWKFSDYEQTSETLTFTNKTQAQNVNVGYVARRYTSAQTGIRFSNIYAKTDSVTMLSMGYPNQYLNKYDIMGCAPATQYRMYFYCYVQYGTTTDYGIVRNAGAQVYHTTSELLDFFNGVTPLTETTSNVEGLGQLQLTIDVNDVQENGTWIFEGSQNGYYYKATLYFYSMSAYVASDYMSTGAPAGYATEITPMFGLSTDGGKYLLCGDTSNFFTVTGQLYLLILANWVIGDNLTIDNSIVGGFECQFSKSEISDLPVYGTLFNGNSAFYKTSNGNAGQLLRVLSIAEMKTIIGIMPRVGTVTGSQQSNYGYTEDVIWATYVTEDNEFTATLITGDLSDDEFKDKLRPWQYDVDQWADNDYTEEDLPPYEPEPEPGSDEDEGTIPLNTPGALGATNAFTTRYVLNTTQIRTIGQELWSTIGDGNELTWQNFFLTLSGSDKIDYSLTLSEVISYFVSLKYFPFSLNSVSSTTGENGIRIGTGKSLIDAGSTTKTLNDSIVQLDGGRCTIPDKWNNYLDLEPYATASLYVPYCGTTELPMSVIAGETIGITYLVDMTTGAMTAAVMKYSGSGAYFPIAVMNGSCGFDILMTGTNGNSQMTNAITNLASKSTQWVGQTLQSGLTGLMGGVSGKDTSGMGALSGMANTVMGIGQDMIQQNIQMPKLCATAPMTSGSSSSLSSLILPQTAYIQIRRHNPYRLGGNYQDELGLIGYRSAYQGLISSANGMGFVKCQNPNLAEVADAGATEAEINMIKSLLSDGIFT